MFASHPPYGGHLHSVTVLLAVAAPVFILLLHRHRWKVSLKWLFVLFPLMGLACVWLRDDLRMLAYEQIGVDWKTVISAFVLSAVIVWGVTRPRVYEPSSDDGYNAP